MQSLRAVYDGRSADVPQARHDVQDALVAWDLADLSWTASLLVTELCSNALLHAHGPFTVTLDALPDGGARLGVSDGSRRLPRSRRYADDATTGRGLHLLQELAASWGSEVRPDGKTVWAVLAAQPAAVPVPEQDGDLDVDALLLAFPEPDVTGTTDAAERQSRSA